MIFTGTPGANPLWCPTHWGSLSAEERGAIGIGLSVSLLMAIVQDEQFMDACGRDERKQETADPSRIQTMITKPPFCPVCCYLEEKTPGLFERLREEVTAGTSPGFGEAFTHLELLRSEAKDRLPETQQ